MSLKEKFIQNHFRIRTCYKYKGVKFELCECGRNKSLHSVIPSLENSWSYENNTKVEPCDTFGEIKFTGYDNVSIDHKPKFIRFNCKNEELISDATYKLIVEYWKFPNPRLIISVNGGFKRMNFKTNQQKKNFKQGLIEVMKKETTWIIGGGFNVGIHKLVSEAVHEYRLHHEGNKDQIKLIGISTWGVVRNNDSLVNKPTEENENWSNNSRVTAENENLSNNSRVYSYANSNATEKGKVTLDAHYDCFLFCDDGTEKQYDREIDFRLNFEKYVQNRDEAFAVQILYEGGKRALENAHRSLSESVPLVVIKGSGRAANIISQVLEMDKESYSKGIILTLEEYKDDLKLSENEMKKFHDYLVDIYHTFRSQIIIHDILDKNMKLDKKILEAIISSRKDKNLEQTLNLTIRFNCHDIADAKVFQNSNFTNIKPITLKENIKEVIEKNRPEFLRLFLDNNVEIETYLDKECIIDLYNVSRNRCRCADLLNDLISNEDKIPNQRTSNSNMKRLLPVINKVISTLSGNILKKSNSRGSSWEYNTYKKTVKYKFRKPKEDSSNDQTTLEEVITGNDKMYENNKNQITYKDLFLWAILSGHIEMALIFWKIGKDHIGSALIASIILNKMENLILKRGDSDMSIRLSEASKKFQEMAASVIMEAYNANQAKAHTLLIRKLKRWNNMSCLQIAISGNLLNFLNLSVCHSYTRKAWMGELSPSLSTWKILVTIPFSLVLIKPLIIPTFIQKNTITPGDTECATPVTSLQNPLHELQWRSKKTETVKYMDAITKFYGAPIVKFIVHLVSYIFFLFIFAYLNMVELTPITIFGGTNSSGCNNTGNIPIMISPSKIPAEIFVTIFILAFFIEEIRQVMDQERSGTFYKVKAYLSGSWNIFDVSIISLFMISMVLRFVIPCEYFIITRCAYSVTFSMFCLRIMQFYFISRSIGPKVIMIKEMMFDILFFLSIFVLFVLSYGILVQSLQNPQNTNSILFIIKDIFYKPYFQTYGELMLDDFGMTENLNNDTIKTVDIIKYSAIYIGFAIFLLLTNILLINLLIAMFGHTFNQIQGESEKVFSFIQVQLVEEFHQKPFLPPPFNMIYYFISIIIRTGNQICNKTDLNQENVLINDLVEDETIKMTGFEQLCMDSSMMELQPMNQIKPSSKSDTLVTKVLEYMDKEVNHQDDNPNKKSENTILNSRLEKIEKLLESLIKPSQN